jgi:hypothetical protein
VEAILGQLKAENQNFDISGNSLNIAAPFQFVTPFSPPATAADVWLSHWLSNGDHNAVD